MNLYQISNEYQKIFDEIGEEGEIDEVSISKLTSLETAITDKAIAIASFIKNIDAERTAIAEAKKAMAMRETRLNKKIEYLESYLQHNMEATGITEISSSPYFTIKLKKCPPSVDVEDETQIPNEYFKEKVVRTLDKLKLRDELKNGVIVQGARLVQNNSLQIR